MTAATLHRLSGGRFVLGLGPSTSTLVEGFHDVRFAHPAAKLREVTTRTRALLAGERTLLDGRSEVRPLRLGQPAAPDLPIWLAAMGDRTDPSKNIREANPHPRPDAGVVPAGAQVVLDRFTAHGTPQQVRDQLAGWDAVDLTMIGLPPGLPWDLVQTTSWPPHP